MGIRKQFSPEFKLKAVQLRESWSRPAAGLACRWVGAYCYSRRLTDTLLGNIYSQHENALPSRQHQGRSS